MSYRIDWNDQALARLAEEWDKQTSQKRVHIMNALDGIDRMLSREPLEVGESRESHSERLLVHEGLAIAYRVNHRMQSLTIYGARLL